MPATVEVKCKNKACGKVFTARVADRKRGWGRFCSKSCKALVQEKRTGQFADMLHKNYRGSGVSKEVYERYQDEYGGIPEFHNGEYVGFTGFEFFDSEHDCNKPWD